jgi:dCMP deaminase
MSDAVVAYIPVLHEGYRRFLDRHGRARPLYLIGPELHEDYRPLAKDIRALDPELLAPAIASWAICSEVDVLDAAGAARLAAAGVALTFPAEDISYRVAERWFPRSPVSYASAFLRWDKTRTVQMLEPRASYTVDSDELMRELVEAGEAQAGESIDWWRQVGAAMRFADGTLATARNRHLPHEHSAYAVGDPRSNFYKGVHIGLTTAVHAEAELIADAAREGRPTQDATMYVTDFPCPACAKLIAAAGIAKLYFRTGYAVLDGQDILEAAQVEVVNVLDGATR